MKNPFIAGSWVRGRDFVGRENLIEEVFSGRHSALWICGTRRLGKTSLLKQIEFLAQQKPHRQKYLPLLWDFQGASDDAGLNESLLESIEDAEDRMAEAGIAATNFSASSVTENLRNLRRRAAQADLTVLLLCDECEELLTIEKNSPALLPRLRRALNRGENQVTVLAATRRLMKLEEGSTTDTSPFLHGLIPPFYLSNLTGNEARQLLAKGKIEADAAQRIMEVTGCHPYLLQLLCRRFFEQEQLEAVIEEMCSDDLVGRFFEVDFQYLNENEQRILWEMLQDRKLTIEELAKKTAFRTENLQQMVYTLLQSGYIREEGSILRPANYFFERWLRREQDRLFAKFAPGESPSSRLPKSADERGKRIGKYHILAEIGRGGMGTVYKARDERLDRLVALKTLEGSRAADAEFLERFYREARTISRLNHPHITTIYDIHEAADRPYLVMEFVPGQTVTAWRDAQARTPQEKINVALQIMSGLDFAHQNGIIHRDIKPENIMVTPGGAVKLMDFGLAFTLGDQQNRMTTEGQTLGTATYMAPEILGGAKADIRSDIYACGVVLYELFCGTLPYPHPNQASYLYAVMHSPATPPQKAWPDIPTSLEAILLKMLEKKPEHRYNDLTEPIKVLQGL